ncbi:atos homolog protein A [Trichomycterus rosablanca]|uniref:atos homolog protein A n=1 Tax=Trichomycterus rosablanca TaxID=2290929 RepID=UPI002F357167
MFKEIGSSPTTKSADRKQTPGKLEDSTAHTMKPDRDAVEEFFEYDAEEFLVSLTLLITEGRTPECSVKGRTEGLHCPPAQSGVPVLTKHECSDKLPQCRQARRTRSEVMLLWRNHIPIMIEVMLLPDCCYSDEGLATDLNDPAMKQDALLLERWTLQPVPRQSGDRFIEEKTLLLAVRSYVFFSQLSAWLSASHGVVPRNILYRISAADEELIWNFSQSPSEHAFPIPNVSHSVALKVRVQSLPRQPKYPVLKCSIHSDLSFLSKRGLEPSERTLQGALSRGQAGGNPPNSPKSSPLLCRQVHSPMPSCDRKSPVNLVKLPGSPVLPGKASKLLFPQTNGVLESSGKTPSVESQSSPSSSSRRDFKSLSNSVFLPPGPSLRPSCVETNPLIGSLLQERQEVIARIAQRLNFCDPTTPHLLPDALFGSPADEKPFKKTKDHPTSQTLSPRSSPLSPRSRSRERSEKDESRTSPKPASCRRLVLSPDSKEGSMIAEAVQDISRLIQERLQLSQEILHTKYKLCREPSGPGTPRNQSQNQNQSHTRNQNQSPDQGRQLRTNHNHTSYANGTTHVTDGETGATLRASSEPIKTRASPETQHRNEGPLTTKPQPVPQTSHKRTHSAKNHPWTSFLDTSSPKSSHSLNGDLHDSHENLQDLQDLRTEKENQRRRGEPVTQPEFIRPAQDPNQDPWSSLSSTPTSLSGPHSPSPDSTLGSAPHTPQRSPASPLKPCSNWKKQNRHSIDGTATRAFHPCTGLPLLSSPVPQRRSQTGYFDLDTCLIGCKRAPWASSKRVCLNRSEDTEEPQQILSASAPPASLSLLGNFEECVLNYRLEPLGTVEGFTAEVGASGSFCPSHMTFPVDVSFYSVSDDNAPSPYMGVINLESLGKRGYRVPPSGTIQVTLFNPNKTVVKMFVVMYDLREMPAGHQTFLRQRTFSVPVKRESNGQNHRKPLPSGPGRTLRYLIHLRFQSSKSGKIYLHRDIRLLFSRKSMEVDSGAAYELKSFTESPANPPFSPRC